MRFGDDALLARLLDRHRDAVAVEPRPGRPTVVRRDQLLTAVDDAGAVEERARRWIDGRHDGAGVCRYLLRPTARVDICALAAELAGRGHAVAPNHLLHAQPIWFGGPVGVPRPTAPLPAPRPRPGSRAVTVAVLDTGLSPHPWYADTAWYAEQRADVAETLDADLDHRLDPAAGHGTFVAGVILQYAPTAALRVQRVLGSDGVGDDLGLVHGLHALARWSARPGRRIDVVNLSLGCYTYDDRPSPIMSGALARLGRDVVTVACAGNGGSDRPFWPAALPGVIAVAALDAAGRERAWFSNHGPWVNACARGVDVTSAFVNFDGPRPPERGRDPDLFGGYATWSGTSFAAPRVAGAVAARCAAAGIAAPSAAGEVLDPARAPALPGLGIVLAD